MWLCALWPCVLWPLGPVAFVALGPTTPSRSTILGTRAGVLRASWGMGGLWLLPILANVLGPWAYGCLCIWPEVCMSPCVHAYMRPCVRVPMDAFVRALMGQAAFGPSGPWVHRLMPSGLLNPCATFSNCMGAHMPRGSWSYRLIALWACSLRGALVGVATRCGARCGARCSVLGAVLGAGAWCGRRCGRRCGLRCGLRCGPSLARELRFQIPSPTTTFHHKGRPQSSPHRAPALHPAP